MSVSRTIEITGDAALQKNLNRLVDSMKKKIARKAMGKGVKPIQKKAVSMAPKKTGLLKRAIKTKVTKKASGKVYVDPKVFAVKNRATGGEFKRVSLKGAGKMSFAKIKSAISEKFGESEYQRPAKYAHLLEFGTSKMKQRKPFMRPALQQGRGAAISEIAKSMRAELKKLGAA